jgi:hypothetical protein
MELERMRRLTVEEVHARKIHELGLDPDLLDLATPEGIAGAMRRAAIHRCPCSFGTLIKEVLDPLRGLVHDLEDAQELAEVTLQAMISHGDLLELNDEQDGTPTTRMLLYAAPPSFVIRESGLAILVGIATDPAFSLPTNLGNRIQHSGHLRKLIPSVAGENLREELSQLGLNEHSLETWLKGPKKRSASQTLATVDHALDGVEPSRDVPGLAIIDPARAIRYYNGRWTEPRSHTGRFVARRKQAYGEGLWCFVQLAEGKPERLIDLPLPGSRWYGRDEAWHLQMAIDAERGKPQQFSVRPTNDAVILELFAPVPAWAQRRWDAIGEPVAKSGCLFAYRLPREEIEEERRFLREFLWLEEVPPRGRARELEG